MQLSTKHMGEIEYKEENIIYFKNGIPGFETHTKFIIVLSGNEELPFHYLQSVENEHLAFVITDPFLFVPNYDFEIPDDVVESMAIENPEDLSIYAIVNIPQEISQTTMNLAAPLVVNNVNNRGCQAILPDRDDIKYRIFNQVSTEGEK